eukprot:969094-Pyramimonas_sp.AAC.1
MRLTTARGPVEARPSVRNVGSCHSDLADWPRVPAERSIWRLPFPEVSQAPSCDGPQYSVLMANL